MASMVKTTTPEQQLDLPQKPPPPPSQQTPPTFSERRDLQYLEKLTCRVLLAIQTYGMSDLTSISTAVRADPKAVAEVLDVLYATPLISLEHSQKSSSDTDQQNALPIKYKYTHSLHGLQHINAASYQKDYLFRLHQVNETNQRVQALKDAIKAAELLQKDGI